MASEGLRTPVLEAQALAPAVEYDERAVHYRDAAFIRLGST